MQKDRRLTLRIEGDTLDRLDQFRRERTRTAVVRELIDKARPAPPLTSGVSSRGGSASIASKARADSGTRRREASRLRVLLFPAPMGGHIGLEAWRTRH